MGIQDIARYLLETSKRNKQDFYNTLVGECFSSFGPILLGLALLGWFGDAWGQRRFLDEMFLLSVFLFALSLLLSAHLLQFRYFMPVLPLLNLWASKGIDHFSRWAETTGSNILGRNLSARNKLY